MSNQNGFALEKGFRLLMADVGINPINVLRRAGLPDDLFSRPDTRLSTEEFFGFWRALELEGDDPLLLLKMGKAITVEAFNPVIFAALCSSDLDTALVRISKYKRLICPMALNVTKEASTTTIELKWLEAVADAPLFLAIGELMFFVQLARLATREEIFPISVKSPRLPPKLDAYTEYFGVRIQKGENPTLVFSSRDAERPFLTADHAMWQFFEPELQKRLSELEGSETVSERVQAALLELLPSGDASIEAVCRKLGTSKRTLQRKLRSGDETFQSVLNETRAKLASHYLKDPGITSKEISFLLGYDNPNSFFRAFHSWTGKTPEQARAAITA